MEEKSSRRKKEKIPQDWLIIAGIILMIIAIVALFLFFMNGQTSTTGDWREDESTKAISCEMDGLTYPFLSSTNADTKYGRINATFSNDKLMSLSFIYRLSYKTEAQAKDSGNTNHAAMNKVFGNDSLGADAFEARYSVQGIVMQMNLYAEYSELNSTSIKYFLLNQYFEDGYTTETVQNEYEEQGLICATINQ